MKKLLVIAILALGFNSAKAQQNASATANSDAEIVTPISIANTGNLSFGNLAVHATNAGTVVMSPAGSRSSTGGVTLPSTNTITPAAASFTVSGQNNYTYAISISASATLSDGGGHTMLVNTFTSTPSGTGTIGSGGTQTLTVGGTLNVANGQHAATYNTTNAGGSNFSVTVNYN